LSLLFPCINVLQLVDDVDKIWRDTGCIRWRVLFITITCSTAAAAAAPAESINSSAVGLTNTTNVRFVVRADLDCFPPSFGKP